MRFVKSHRKANQMAYRNDDENINNNICDAVINNRGRKRIVMGGQILGMILLLLAFPVNIEGGDTETFTYKDTDTSKEEYGPQDWINVGCDTVGSCAGWPDDWELGYDWGFEGAQNSCHWCPLGDIWSCGKHHMSPINLARDLSIQGTELFKQCIDWHWMHYEDGTCDPPQLRAANAFKIERHALRIKIPYEEYTGPGPGEPELGQYYQLGWQPACTDKTGQYRHWPRIDFSKGFPDWFFMSHTDIKIPSEHTQEGKQYSAEVQMYHFYSVSRNAPPDENGNPQENEMAAVSVFLEAYDDVPPYPHLDRMICEWRYAEDKIREACGEDSIGTPYAGCFTPDRGFTPFPTATATQEPTAMGGGGGETTTPAPAPATTTTTTSAAPVTPMVAPTETPVLVAPTDAPVAPQTDAPVEPPSDAPVLVSESTNAPVTSVPVSTPAVTSPVTSAAPAAGSPTLRSRQLGQEEADGKEQQQQQRKEEEDPMQQHARRLRKRIVLDESNFRPPAMTDEEWLEFIEATSAHGRGVATEAQRKLLGQEHLTFHNYQWMLDARTEYYFRYQGTQTIPPCWGEYIPGSRAQTNHWRILKDPIRVHPRQIEEMSRLIRDRIDPDTCRKDTAAKVERDGRVNVARPVQQITYDHFATFCECPDGNGFGWPSKWPEDREWCRAGNGDQQYRFYAQPYNYLSGNQY